MYVTAYMWRSEDNLRGVGSLLPPCASQGKNSGLPAGTFAPSAILPAQHHLSSKFKFSFETQGKLLAVSPHNT